MLTVKLNIDGDTPPPPAGQQINTTNFEQDGIFSAEERKNGLWWADP